MKFNNDWDTLFQQEIQKNYFKEINLFLEQEYKEKEIYPEKENIFRALLTTPLEKTKVVILGQDPYHGPGQAQGYSFSVPADFPLPPSLKNIYKEIEQEYGVSLSRNGDLSDWAKQGVLLLNTVLTVQRSKPLSHAKIGWQTFTNEVLKTINKKEGAVVFLLWGAKAQEAMKYLDNPSHLVLTSPHPSPFSCHRGFFGNNHFKTANDYLIKHNETPIEWF